MKPVSSAVLTPCQSGQAKILSASFRNMSRSPHESERVNIRYIFGPMGHTWTPVSETLGLGLLCDCPPESHGFCVPHFYHMAIADLYI